MPMTLVIAPATDAIEAHMERRWCVPVTEATEGRTGAPLQRPVQCDRAGVESSLPSRGSVFYFGHGIENALGNPVLVDHDNVAQFEGMLVAIACDAAEELGPLAVAHGVECFVGFTGKLPVVNDPEYDALLVPHLADLASDACDPGTFRQRFRDACATLSDRMLSGRTGNPNAHVIAISADSMRGSIRVIKRGHHR